MAEKNDDKVCSICLHDFNQPKILDCSHSFCYTCLHGYIEKSAKNNIFQCPLCRRDITVPDGGVEEFPSDQKIKVKSKDTSDEDNLNSGGIIPNCDACKRDVASTCKCQECDLYMCDSCKLPHDMFPGTKNHVVTKLDEVIVMVTEIHEDNSILDPCDLCPDHVQKPVDVYCEQCLISVCFSCFLKQHNGHQFLNLQDKDVQQDIRQELKSLTQDLQNQIKKLQMFSDSLTTKLSQVQDSGETTCKNVDSQVEKICNAVKNQGEILKIKIVKICEEGKQKLEKLMNEVQGLSDKLKSCVKTSMVVLDDNFIVEVLKLIPDSKQEIENISSQEFKIPDLKSPWFHENRMNKDVLSEQIGKLEILDGPSFISSFKVDDLIREGGCFSPVHVIDDLKWCIYCKNANGYLWIELQLKEDIKCCHGKSTIKLINKDDSKSVTRRDEEDYKFLPNERWLGWGFITWNTLTNPLQGFIDEEKNFNILMTFKLSTIER